MIHRTVPGNQEFFLQADPARRKMISNAFVLMDEAIEVEGLKIYGSPVTRHYGGLRQVVPRRQGSVLEANS